MSDTINTIILYALVEILAVHFMHLANKERKNKRQFIISKSNNLTIRISRSLGYIALSFLPLLLLMILKSDSVGVDTRAYKTAYEAISNGTLNPQQSSWLGIGFRSIATFFTFLHLDYHVFFACLSFITLALFYQTIWKHSKNPALSIFIFISTCLFFQTFNQYRQMLAIAIVFFSYNFIASKYGLLKFIICIIIAASIHNSALIFMPMFFIAKIKMNNITIALYLALTIIAHILYIPLLSLLSNTYYGQMYIGTYMDLSFKLSTILNMAIRIFLLGFCLISYKKMIKLDKASQAIYHIVIICTIIQSFVVRSYPFSRLTTYFFVFYLLLIPNTIFYVFKNNLKFLYCVIAFFICYQLFYYGSSSAVESGYRVYKFYLEEPKKE